MERSDETRSSLSSDTSRLPRLSSCRRGKKTRETSPEVIRPENKRYNQALEYFTYGLVDKTLEYVGDVAKNSVKWVKEITTQVRSYTFEALDLTSVLSFLSVFIMACDTTGIQECAAGCLFHLCMKVWCTTALNGR